MNSNENSFVILIPGFPDSEEDTTCLPMQQAFARNLKEQYPGLRFVILAFQYPYKIKHYEWFGIEVMSFSGRNAGGFRRFFLRRKLLATLKNIHQENKICGILSFWYGECAWIGKMFADKYKVDHYCWIMGQDARQGNKYPPRLKIGADHLIALSDFLSDEFQKNYKQKPAHVVPAGVDPHEFSKNEPGKDIDVLGAGSLIPLKRFDIFIEIIARLKNKFPDIRAMILGEGPEKNRLLEKIHQLELSDNLQLTGELAHPQVLQLMQRSKVFLHPSDYEGFSGVCLEALYAGAQVISSTQPMKNDIDGWQIAGSVSEMELRIENILRANEVHKTIRNQFLMENTAKSLMSLYQPG